MPGTILMLGILFVAYAASALWYYGPLAYGKSKARLSTCRKSHIQLGVGRYQARSFWTYRSALSLVPRKGISIPQN